MSESKSSKEAIIWKAYGLFRERGYHNTSMSDIGKACGLLKGSIYHYFESKQALMEGVLQAVHHLFRQDVFSFAFAIKGTPKERLQSMMSATEKAYLQEKGGCIMANTGGQEASHTPSIMHIIRQFFNEWIEAFTHLFKDQYGEGKALELARQAVQEIEGAIILYCIFFDKVYFTTTRHRIEGLLS